MNSAAVNMGMQTSLRHHDFFSLGHGLRSAILSSIGALTLEFIMFHFLKQSPYRDNVYFTVKL
jgi:hypothetical protein